MRNYKPLQRQTSFLYSDLLLIPGARVLFVFYLLVILPLCDACPMLFILR